MPFGVDFWKQVADMGIGAVVALIILFYGFRFLREWQKSAEKGQLRMAEVMDNHLSAIEKSLAIMLERQDVLQSSFDKHDAAESRIWSELIDRIAPIKKPRKSTKRSIKV